MLLKRKKKRKKNSHKQRGKGLPNTNMQDLLQKKTLIGVLFEKSSPKVFYYLIFEMQNLHKVYLKQQL